MSELRSIENALRRADAAGDVEGARTLAAEYRRLSALNAASEVASFIPPQDYEFPESPPDQNWADLPGNIPGSAVRLAEGIYQAARHPINTASTIGDAVLGGIDRIPKPEWLREAQKSLPWSVSQETIDRRRRVSGAVGEMLMDRYGGFKNIKQTAINDPVGIAADFAGLVSGGGAAVSAVSKTGKVGRVGAALTKAGDMINPVSIAVKTAKHPVSASGKAIANVLSIPTGVSGESIIEAARAGYRGGEYGKAFRDNMRGKVPQELVIDNARAALDAMSAKRSADYVSGMRATKANLAPAGYARIENSMNDLVDSMFHGKTQTANNETINLTKKVGEVINEWQREYPNPTAYDLDRLKVRIDGLKPSFTSAAPGQERVITTVRNAVKDEILSADPGYAETMRAYELSKAAQGEIERSLSLGRRSTKDTALRKLQSVTRNNANTNYGGRISSANVLERAGAKTLMAELAGQQLNSFTPRGLARYVTPTVGASGMAGSVSANPALLPIVLAGLAASSPRVVGELAHFAGRAASVPGRAGVVNSSLAALASGKAGDYVNQLYKRNRP